MLPPSPDRLRLLFWGVCLPVRTAIGLLVLFLPRATLPYAGALLAAVSLGFVGTALLVLTGHKTKGGFHQDIWWNAARPVHALLWGVASAAALARVERVSGAVLLGDVLFGAAAWVALRP